MTVKVSDLRPNPFRKMDKYPIDKVKVEELKTSIKETSFWDNVLARRLKSGHFEIAYGHHRLVALQELDDIKEVDIPVKKLDDSQMLRIMANENLDSWKTNPRVVYETILTTKEFLNAELQKYESWEEYPPENRRVLFEGKKGDYKKARKQGVGQPTILKFLGGNWKKWVIEQALSVLKDKTLDKGAVESFPTIEQAGVFRRAIKEFKVKKKDQKEMATEIIKDGKEASKRKIRAAVRKRMIDDPLKKAEKKTDEAPDISEVLENTIKRQLDVNSVLKEIFENKDNCDSKRLKYLIMLILGGLRRIQEYVEEGDRKWKLLPQKKN